MSMFSRREFGRTVLAGVPVVAALGSIQLGASAKISVGVSTDSYRDLPRVVGRDNVDDVIRALQAARVTGTEVAFSNFEPAPAPTAPFMAGSAAYPQRVVLTPEQILSMNTGARLALRAWRIQTTAAFFETVRGKLSAAGLAVHAGALAYDDSFTDDEIDATFRHAKMLGVATVSSPMTMAIAKRVIPFAERHRVAVAIHNQVDGNTGAAIATSDLDAALALSSCVTLKFDIGNVTASGRDTVAVLRRYLPRVSHVLVKDRLRNGGASQYFGEGDTPIAGVLNVLKASPGPIPVFIEYDYVGLRPPADEVAACVAYVSGRT